jgi:hypothetical protein
LIDTTTQVLSVLIILLTLVIMAVLSRRRRTPFPLRTIPAFAVMPALTQRAIEADRPVHISLGSAGLGGETTLLAVAGAELAYQLSSRAAMGVTSPILTLTDPSALPLAQDTLRRAYQSRRLSEHFRANNARWYPAGARSLAYAAAVTALMADENVSSNVMVGSFGPELALIMEASARRNIPIIAVSDQLEGQAIAYALSDEPLIGEEVFAGGPYLGGNPQQTAESVTIDILRWLLVLAMLIGLIAAIRGG